MDPTQEALFEQLLEQHPECRVCGGPTEAVRARGNPKWGFEPDGYTPRKQISGWLAEEAVRLGLVEIDGTCVDHLEWVELNGAWQDPRKQSPTPKGNWMKRQRTDRVQARKELIAALGGKCHVCHEEFASIDFLIRTPERVRRDAGIRDQAEWYRYLAERPGLLAETTLLCLEHRTSPDRTDATSPREKVIRAYGGSCFRADCDADERLMVVALPGTPPLRWPSGAKYNSVARVEYLVRHGFPRGYAVACPKHLSALGRGE